MARAPALHAGGQGFDSLILHIHYYDRVVVISKFFDMLKVNGNKFHKTIMSKYDRDKHENVISRES